ncbi:elongin-A-like [Bufo gargarizans]|uniref:elongin-A-like n=1 Tax=Bufo gargarizans TaxID=30331 RepID=UPI001CF57C60|nr:elongin-A-like [Bufo gargarizans]
MDSQSIVQRVQQLKDRLGNAQDPKKKLTCCVYLKLNSMSIMFAVVAVDITLSMEGFVQGKLYSWFQKLPTVDSTSSRAEDALAGPELSLNYNSSLPAARPSAVCVHHRLGDCQEEKISKALKSLQELDITLDILVETGVGKTVNSFRKHTDVGDIAKSIVLQWKKLVPEVKELDHMPNPRHEQKEIMENKKIITKSRQEQKEILEDTKKISKSKEQNLDLIDKKLASKSKQGHIDILDQVNVNVKEKHFNIGKAYESQMDNKKQKEFIETKDGKLHDKKCLPKEMPAQKCQRKHEKPCSNSQSKTEKSKSGHQEKKNSHSLKSEKKSKSSTEDEDKCSGSIRLNRKDVVLEMDKKVKNEKTENVFSSEEFEAPTMSFESYLNYDQVSSKRKKKSSHPLNEPPRKIEKVCKQYCNLDVPKTQSQQKNEEKVDEVEVKKSCLEDLLNVPLPKILTDYAVFPSPPHPNEYKEKITEFLPDKSPELNGFTGRRLNSKMLVYSGSKIMYLPKMLSLYEQCLRILQNNIDSIQEVGGVPFDILKPVLERCTPEQLNRIEECNPVFMEDSGNLWKKHCERDFKGHRLLEYESWREMYLRLYNEREEKLRKITQNISSAHSGKPRGRQVKLAYIHGVAKPPRNIRRQQEIHGTAGPVVQPHPLEKYKMQKLEIKEGSASTQNSNAYCNTTMPVSNSQFGQSQDQKRAIKKIAPMMAKTMRAFKNRVGPR